MKDRLSIHLDNGQSEVREAVTVLRNGGTAAQSGLVGITNATYSAGSPAPVIPETIFNVQSTGNSHIRFSSGPSQAYTSNLELIGNGNGRASGLIITYDPNLDNAVVNPPGYGGYGEFCVDPNTLDRNVAYFSLVRPSGSDGAEFSHLTLTERGYLGIGLTRRPESDGVGYEHTFTPIAPLTVAYVCDNHNDSGVIAIHEQSAAPAIHAGYGKIYVKPFTTAGRSQALFFKDDAGVETNLVLEQELDPLDGTNGLIYGDSFGNTHGGWFTSSRRIGNSQLIGGLLRGTIRNTLYGFGAGFYIGQNIDPNRAIAEDNTLIGFQTGSGLLRSISSNPNVVRQAVTNTVVGSKSLINYESAQYNVIIGWNNAQNRTQSDPDSSVLDNAILIGTDLSVAQGSEGDLRIGHGSNPLLIGKTTSTNKFLTINGGYLSVLEDSSTEFKVTTSGYLVSQNRNIVELSVIDYNKGGANHASDKLEVTFKNEDGLSNKFLELDPRLGPLDNIPTYAQADDPVQHATLNSDLRLQGAIRFQDGTSLSGLSTFNLTPLDLIATQGISVAKNFPNLGEETVALNYSSLNVLGSVVDTANTYIAVQYGGSSSSSVAKLSIDGLKEYFGSSTDGGGGGGGTTPDPPTTGGGFTISENCNLIATDDATRSSVNTAVNTGSVILGCDAGASCSGQVNSIFIGRYAGKLTKTTNDDLSSPFNNIFIGPYAGMDTTESAYSICIGVSAGRNSDQSNSCTFIGNAAGLDSTQSHSIGIGGFALKGHPSNIEVGSGNIEIVAGLEDGDRLFSDASTLSLTNRLAINKVIAGRSDFRNISIGDARLSPTAPLEVRYDDTVGHENNPTVNDNKVIQSWYCNDNLVAYMTCDGQLVSDTQTRSSLFVEGLLAGPLAYAPAINDPKTATLNVYQDGVATGEEVTITNRDATLGAGSAITPGTYIVAIRLGSEYRPIWVGCY